MGISATLAALATK